MSLEMQNDNELVMESMVSVIAGTVEPKAKKVSKSLTMNEKRSMYNILSFLVIANRDGILDDAKTQELMEHLPIFGTISEKKAFLSQEMFDMKMIEKDILKPMVLEHNNNRRSDRESKKKQEKKEEKKKGKKEKEAEGVLPKEVKPKVPKEPKEPKKRAPKKEKVVEGVEEVVKKDPKKRAPKKKVEDPVEPVEEVLLKEEVKKDPKKKVEKEEKKRGRKAKQQIVECNTDVNVNAGNSQEDQLANLVNQLTSGSVLELKHPDQDPNQDQDQDPEKIDLADLDEVLSNLEEGEVQEENRVMTPRLPEVEVEVEVEKKGKGKDAKKKVVTKPKTIKK